MKGFVVLGKLGAPHGVKGWVRVNSFTENQISIFEYPSWSIGFLEEANSFREQGATRQAADHSGKRLEKVTVEAWREHGQKLIAKIKGIDVPETARRFTGMGIYVPEQDLPALENDDYYWKDLEGCIVFNLEQKNLGRVEYLIETGANDVLVVRPTPESIDDAERLIPYIPGEVIKRVDIQGRAGETAELEGKGSLISVDWDEAF